MFAMTAIYTFSPARIRTNPDLFLDLFFFDFDGADDGAEFGFWMSWDANRCRRCSCNQSVTVKDSVDTEEVVGSNPIVPTILLSII
jgi:hypothetical protein